MPTRESWLAPSYGSSRKGAAASDERARRCDDEAMDTAFRAVAQGVECITARGLIGADHDWVAFDAHGLGTQLTYTRGR